LEAVVPTEKLLDAQQVSERLGIPKQSVWSLARQGLLPAVRISERRVRFRPEDLDRWVAERSVIPAPAVDAGLNALAAGVRQKHPGTVVEVQERH
jgi:excisionase family DNA binding protein